MTKLTAISTLAFTFFTLAAQADGNSDLFSPESLEKNNRQGSEFCTYLNSNERRASCKLMVDQEEVTLTFAAQLKPGSDRSLFTASFVDLIKKNETVCAEILYAEHRALCQKTMNAKRNLIAAVANNAQPEELKRLKDAVLDSGKKFAEAIAFQSVWFENKAEPKFIDYNTSFTDLVQKIRNSQDYPKGFPKETLGDSKATSESAGAISW